MGKYNDEKGGLRDPDIMSALDLIETIVEESNKEGLKKSILNQKGA